MSDIITGQCDGCGRRAVVIESGDRVLCAVCAGADHARRLAAVRSRLCPECELLPPLLLPGMHRGVGGQRLTGARLMDLRIDWLAVSPATSTTGGKWVKVSTSTLRTLSVRATPLWRTALPAPRPRGLSSTGVRAGLPKPGSARGVADALTKAQVASRRAARRRREQTKATELRSGPVVKLEAWRSRNEPADDDPF